MISCKNSWYSKIVIIQAIAVAILSVSIMPRILMQATAFIHGSPAKQIEQQLKNFGTKSLEKGLIEAFEQTKNESYDLVDKYFKTYVALAILLACIISWAAYI